MSRTETLHCNTTKLDQTRPTDVKQQSDTMIENIDV